MGRHGRSGRLSGNKGAVSVSLRVGATRITFINAHLNAHLAELEKRIEDYRAVCAGLAPATPRCRSDRDIKHPLAGDSNAASAVDHEVPNRSDVVFFFGDLNFRVAPPLPTEAEMGAWVVDRVREQQWDALLAHDQLRAASKEGCACAGFSEAEIRFAPTFKLKDVLAADPRERYNLERCPSYCDRVLWRTAAAAHPVQNVLYRSFEGALGFFSDHSPVAAAFCVPLTRLPANSAARRRRGVTLRLDALRWEPHSTYAVAPVRNLL